MENTEGASLDVQKVDTQIEILHSDTKQEITKIVVGQVIPYAGIWLQVVRVSDDEVVMRPCGITAKQVKKMAKRHGRR